MRSELRWGLLLFITLGGCGSGPPFDQLPLRDTLRADPEVVAALPDEARRRLAARFQAAGAVDTSADPVEASAAPAAALAQADVARQHRSADALVIGLVGAGAAQALPTGTQTGVAEPLPAMEGQAATATAELEARGLAGPAGASLRELLAASHARRIERVVGWPVAAVTAGDKAYVNAAWLVAMAPLSLDGGGFDGAAFDGGAARDGAASDAGTSRTASHDGGRQSTTPSPSSSFKLWDGSVWQPPPLPPPPPPPPDDNSLNDAADAADGCASLADACASTDDGSGEDACGSSQDDSADACSAPPDEGGADCQTAPGRGRPPTGTILWLLTPLAYLSGRRR